jgi:hypothetical protein
MTNAAWGDSASQTHAMIARRTMQLLIFRDGVVVGFAFAVAQPSQESQGKDDYADTDAKFCPILHGRLLRQPAKE